MPPERRSSLERLRSAASSAHDLIRAVSNPAILVEQSISAAGVVLIGAAAEQPTTEQKPRRRLSLRSAGRRVVMMNRLKQGAAVVHEEDDDEKEDDEEDEHREYLGRDVVLAALHDGHLSLITKALEQAELVVVSVLVNPTQFNDSSDYDGYPRTLESDAAKAASAGAHAVFAPTAEGLYGGVPTAPEVRWGALTDAYEGAFRAGHFDGVIRVVDLLFQVINY